VSCREKEKIYVRARVILSKKKSNQPRTLLLILLISPELSLLQKQAALQQLLLSARLDLLKVYDHLVERQKSLLSFLLLVNYFEHILKNLEKRQNLNLLICENSIRVFHHHLLLQQSYLRCVSS
jgi:hypothetical protein